jgi:hypothetical protein
VLPLAELISPAPHQIIAATTTVAAVCNLLLYAFAVAIFARYDRNMGASVARGTLDGFSPLWT